jgi:hypothetical protein
MLYREQLVQVLALAVDLRRRLIAEQHFNTDYSNLDPDGEMFQRQIVETYLRIQVEHLDVSTTLMAYAVLEMVVGRCLRIAFMMEPNDWLDKFEKQATITLSELKSKPHNQILHEKFEDYLRSVRFPKKVDLLWKVCSATIGRVRKRFDDVPDHTELQVIARWRNEVMHSAEKHIPVLDAPQKLQYLFSAHHTTLMLVDLHFNLGGHFSTEPDPPDKDEQQ